MTISLKRNVLLVVITLCFILIVCCIFAYANAPVNSANNFERNKYFTSYEIQPGDTLHSIAEKYMTYEYKSEKEYINEIRDINGFIGDVIFAGAYIVIPYYAD